MVLMTTSWRSIMERQGTPRDFRLPRFHVLETLLYKSGVLSLLTAEPLESSTALSRAEQRNFSISKITLSAKGHTFSHVFRLNQKTGKLTDAAVLRRSESVSQAVFCLGLLSYGSTSNGQSLFNHIFGDLSNSGIPQLATASFTHPQPEGKH
ncbi:hypothetical protein I7I51_04135 [Histoplasma capsulatum]|uniref:Uncharacterized protein n=1 Tax=Ajellomyces capsulatus TaxID=5037 RepID=A0A8A1M644_AJECA|nr:hypothetical protein I7I51_04135 [Histoplasma capsulatum]